MYESKRLRSSEAGRPTVNNSDNIHTNTDSLVAVAVRHAERQNIHELVLPEEALIEDIHVLKYVNRCRRR